MSSCCCDCCQPQTTGDQGGGTQQPPRCTQYQLTIQSISVTAIDDGLFGGNLEASFTFVVNGQAKTYDNNDLGVGVTNIGITFFVDVPTDTSTINFTVSGIEHDIFIDDDLADFSQTFGQAQNWGLGFQTGSASDSNITYTLNYQITCAQKTTVGISRDTLLALAREKAKTRKNARPVNDSILVAWAIDRFRRADWDLVTVAEQHYIFSGYGVFPSLVEQRFGERPAQ